MQAITRKANATVLIIVASSLASAPMLLPSDVELGSHLLSDNEHIEARHYLESALIERRQRQDIVIPLAEIYSLQGRHGEGLDLLRSLKRQTPEIARMRRNMLRKSGRLLRYVEDLEHQRGPEPGLGELRELARLYGGQQLIELQLAVLLRMRRNRPNDLVLARKVAYLHLQVGEKFKALAVMRGLWLRQPTWLNRTDFLLLARLWIELDTTDASLRMIDDHIDRVARRSDRMGLAKFMIAVGKFRQAAALLHDMVGRSRATAETIEVWAQAEVAGGRAAQAYAELRKRADIASSRTTRLLCNLALQQRDDAGALRLGGQADFKGLGDATLLALARAAMRLRSRKRLRHILGQISDDALRADAVTTAHMYWSIGQRRDALRWAIRAKNQTSLSRDQRLWLAELYLQAGQPREVARQMRAAIGPKKWAASALRVALMWWRSKAAKAGLSSWPAVRRDPQLRAGKALLLAATQRPRQALRLLTRRSARGGSLVVRLTSLERRNDATRRATARVQQWLQALSAEAERSHYRPLSAWVFAEMIRLTPNDRRLRLALAQAQLGAGKPAQAWATIARLAAPLTTQESTARRQILLAAHRAKVPVGDAVISEVVGLLKTLNLKTAQAQSWLHVLLDAGGGRQALPFVEQLAASGDRPWQSRRVALLTELGDHDAVRQWWLDQGADRTLPKSERLHAANQLLGGKNREKALNIYTSIAATEDPDGSTVQQLLHLWGPRPRRSAVRWLVARAKQTKGNKRAAWLRHLLWINAGDAVLAVTGTAAKEGPLLAVSVDALVLQRRFDDLGKLVAKRASGLKKTAILRRLGQLCAAHQQLPAAIVAFTRLAQVRPNAADALRYLAQATRGKQAIKWWRRLFDVPPKQRGVETWQDRAAYGGLLKAQGRRDEGLQQLRVALRLADDAAMAQRDQIRARLFAQLGRHFEAIAAYKRAVAKQPCNDHLRGDLVSSLMATRQLEIARAFIDRPAHCSDGPSK